MQLESAQTVNPSEKRAPSLLAQPWKNSEVTFRKTRKKLRQNRFQLKPSTFQKAECRVLWK